MPFLNNSRHLFSLDYTTTQLLNNVRQDKTVELLCTYWFKSTKFDPIALLDQLNPIPSLTRLSVSKVANVILRVASTIDCESSVEKGVELVQKHLSGPEIRSLHSWFSRNVTL